MNDANRRRSRDFRPSADPCESRLLLSADLSRSGILVQPGYYHPTRPNTPVLPYASTFSKSTFIDPSVGILKGNRIVLGQQDFVAPYAVLDGRAGYIKIGNGSSILDNAQILANPSHAPGLVGIIVGDSVVISAGASVIGNSRVGVIDGGSAPTYVGPNATIDNATIEPGAYVSALAYVGPGVTIRSGTRVLPGARVTTEAEATNTALGQVAAVTSTNTTQVQQQITDNKTLADAYATLFAGNKATGAALASSNANFFNGDLAAVEGTSGQAGSSVASFQTSTTGPKFPTPHVGLVQGLFYNFPARVTGGVTFEQRAAVVAHRLGQRNSIRGDVGQPLVFNGIAGTGARVAIQGAHSGKLTVGNSFRAGDGVVIIAGPNNVIGDNVTIDSHAVVNNANIGAGSTIGAGAYVNSSTLPAGTVVPAGAIIVNQGAAPK